VIPNFRYPSRALPWPEDLDYEEDVCGIAEEEAGPRIPGEPGGPALVAYKCPAKVWTIGYGETMGGSVVEGMTATLEQVDTWFLASLAKRVAAVRKLCTHSGTTRSHVAALVWFSYNVGVGALATSNVLKLHNAGRFNEVPNALLQWVWATDRETGKKVKLAGLVKRRAKEGARYMKPEYEALAKPTPQAVAPEKPLAASPTMVTTTSTAGLAGVAALAESAPPVGPPPSDAPHQPIWGAIAEAARDVLTQVKAGVSALTGVPERYVLPLALLGALAFVAYRRWNQRRQGLA